MDIDIAGKTITGIPDGLTSDEIKEKLINSGIAVESDFTTGIKFNNDAILANAQIGKFQNIFENSMEVANRYPENAEAEKLGALSYYYSEKDGIDYNNVDDLVARGEMDFSEQFGSNVDAFHSAVMKLIEADTMVESPTYVPKASFSDHLKGFVRSIINVGGDIAGLSFDVMADPVLIDEEKGKFAKAFETIILHASHGGMPVYTQEEYGKAIEAAPEARKMVVDPIRNVVPEDWQASLDELQEDIDSGEMRWYRNGLAMIATQSGNLLAGAANPVIGYMAMTASEQAGMLERLTSAGVSYEDAKYWSTAYGSLAGAIEYWEMWGRLRGAGVKGGVKTVGKQAATMAGYLGINIAEELSQDELGVYIYNMAVDEHNRRNPSNTIEYDKHFQNWGQTAKASSDMSIMLSVLGLPVRSYKAMERVKKSKLIEAERVKAEENFQSYKESKIKLIESQKLPSFLKGMITNKIRESKDYADLSEKMIEIEDMKVDENGIDISKVIPNQDGYSTMDLLNIFLAADPQNKIFVDRLNERETTQADTLKKLQEERDNAQTEEEIARVDSEIAYAKSQGSQNLREFIIRRLKKFQSDHSLDLVNAYKNKNIKNIVSFSRKLVDFVNSLETDSRQRISIQDPVQTRKVKTTPLTKAEFTQMKEDKDIYRVYKDALGEDEELSGLLELAIAGDEAAQKEWNNIAKTEDIKNRIRTNGYDSLSPKERKMVDDFETKKEQEEKKAEPELLEDLPPSQIADAGADEFKKIAKGNIENSDTYGNILKRGMRPFVSVSTRISEINKDIGTIIRKTRMEASLLDNEYSAQLKGFTSTMIKILKEKKKKNENEYYELVSDILNFDRDALINKWKFNEADIITTRDVLDDISNKLELGDKSKYRKDFFPRSVNDYKGLLEYLDKPMLSAMQKKLDAKSKEKGRELAPEEKNRIIRDYLLLSLRKKPILGRTIEKVTPEIARYYSDPITSLASYLHNMSREIAREKFLNIKSDGYTVDPDDVFIDYRMDVQDNDVIDFIRKKVELNKIPVDRLKELVVLIKSDLGQKSTPMLISSFRTLASIKYASGIPTWLSQLADIFVALGENGISNTLSVMLGKRVDLNNPLFKYNFTPEVIAEYFLYNGKKPYSELSDKKKESLISKAKMLRNLRLSLETIGINELDAELQDASKDLSRKISDVVFYPLQKFDVYGKNLLLQSTAMKWEKMVESGKWDKLEKELIRKFGNNKPFLGGIKSELENKTLGPSIQLALYSQMADFHPINHSEHIKFYMDHPNLRAIFILRSFALKRFDRWYREALTPLIDGMVKIKRGLLSEDKDLRKEGFEDFNYGVKGMTRFFVYTLLADAAFNTLKTAFKDALDIDKDVFEEYDGMVKTFYMEYLEQMVGIFPYFNWYTIEKAIEQEDPWIFITKTLEPTKPLFFDIAKSMIKFIKDGEFSDDWQKDMPIIGPFLGAILDAFN